MGAPSRAFKIRDTVIGFHLPTRGAGTFAAYHLEPGQAGRDPADHR